ncbi:MAG: hypothetical protein AAF664_16740 [Planctomycetota bacterium]
MAYTSIRRKSLIHPKIWFIPSVSASVDVFRRLILVLSAMRPSRLIVLFALLSPSLVANDANSPEPRAKRPDTDKSEAYKAAFDISLEQLFKDKSLDLGELRSQQAAARNGGSSADNEKGSQGWSKLISAGSLEEEVKRFRNEFDQGLAAIGPFKSGGYQDSRVQLSVLATLFAVISEYDEDVKWKKQAVEMRVRLARSAGNFRSGSVQVFNEAKQRSGDLADLVNGVSSGNASDSDESVDWVSIADRSVLMEYADLLLMDMEDESSDADSVSSAAGPLARRAELLAMLGKVLVQDEMDDASDKDYASLSLGMTSAATDVARSLSIDDYDSVPASVAKIRQSCSNCHESYR